MKTEPVDPTEQTYQPLQKVSTPTPTLPIQPQPPQASSPHEPDQSNEIDQPERPSEQVMLDKSKLDKLFCCLRKVGSAIQELVDEGSQATHVTYDTSSNSTKEVPSNMISSKSTRDFGCQKFSSANMIHRGTGDRIPLVRSLDEYEALDLIDQRRYLISQVDLYGRQYLKMLEDKDRHRRRLCHLQAEFISLMLPQFSIIHSIMAEGLRTEWQNKLNNIDELTRTLHDVDDRLNFTNDGYREQQSTSGINLSVAVARRSNNEHHEHDEELENEDEPNDFDDIGRCRTYFNGNIPREPSPRDSSPTNESTDSASEYLHGADERLQLLRRAAEAQEDVSGIPVDLSTNDTEIPGNTDGQGKLIKSSRGSDLLKRQYNRKPSNPPSKAPASPKPPGLHKYKICLYRDSGYRCYYIGKDRSCNMRQHWLHRHGIDAPPENFYVRKDLSEADVQKYKLKYEVQKSNFPKSRDPLMSTIFQHTPAKKSKNNLSPQQENTPQQT